MRNKNIGFLISNIDNGGGTERVSLLLGDYLCEKGYRVTFFSYYAKGIPFFNHDPRIRIIGFEGDKWYNQYLKRLYPDNNKRLHFLLKLLRIDVIIDVDMGQAMYSSVAIQGTKCRQITWDHFNYNENQKSESRQKGLECCKKHSSKLVVLTKADKLQYLQKERLSESFVGYIYNPLTIEQSNYIPRNVQRVIAIGRLEKQKGFDLLLNIWAKIENRFTDWCLEIFGIGSEEANLKELIKKHELKNVRLRGRTIDIKSNLIDASLFVLPSRFEGFGLVLTEAEAMSLPIVAFNCPQGPAEIIEDGVNGYLVEPGDLDTFAEKLSILMENAQLREDFGKASFELSKRFRRDIIFPKWIELIENI